MAVEVPARRVLSWLRTAFTSASRAWNLANGAWSPGIWPIFGSRLSARACQRAISAARVVCPRWFPLAGWAGRFPDGWGVTVGVASLVLISSLLAFALR